ncbi:ABC transporter ATP-binding protein [Crateriforma conspicua]|uniref:ABC-type transporter ATP-binding protein EcsA n=1 Tax=Crateriforma conspicua TaxID=2527996 RepID=A0A5C5Y9N9_9PLAN|nr:ABC transporter ATP-binding protein [Crateriforma conspicua]TWT72397.1 ABC-type transporter ATP-binding protein EcsA [Crateriforma conspicua]
MIVVNELSKVYDDHLAVAGVTFQLQQGQVCGLVGPNGAGKTSTLRCIAGLIGSSDGEIRVNDLSVTLNSAAVKRQIAYVPDDPPLFDDLTVGDHLEFIGQIYDIPDARTKASYWLNRFDLAGKYDAGATTLSRGMRQKLAVCCAYLADPKILLLDEPLTGLDPPAIRTLLDSVHEMAENGKTVILSSHLLAMISEVCTHLLVMKSGQAVYFGPKSGLVGDGVGAESLEAAFFAATESSPLEMVAT